MAILTSSVGRGGENRPEDVRVVQDLLNKCGNPPSPPLAVSGAIDPRTVAAIAAFQKTVMHTPDGRVDPGGKTFAALIRATGAVANDASSALPAVRGGARLSEADFARAAKRLDCEVACVKAVTEVEAGGGGFYASGRPKILFEAHVFSRRTEHQYDASHPDISSFKWNRKLYKRGEDEYERLEKAVSVNREAALESASWGLFQIMGFHYKNAGFDSVDAYVEAMFESEGRQLDAFIDFLKATKIDTHLRAKRWADFAKAYNGPGYAQNKYDLKLAAAYKKYAG
jgi:hypothetical protein